MECDKWRIPGDLLPLNGVEIGYEIKNKQHRELLHEIGQRHGLIPLCPRDVIDIDLTMMLKVSSKEELSTLAAYVDSPIGRLYIKKDLKLSPLKSK